MAWGLGVERQRCRTAPRLLSRFADACARFWCREWGIIFWGPYPAPAFLGSRFNPFNRSHRYTNFRPKNDRQKSRRQSSFESAESIVRQGALVYDNHPEKRRLNNVGSARFRRHVVSSDTLELTIKPTGAIIKYERNFMNAQDEHNPAVDEWIASRANWAKKAEQYKPAVHETICRPVCLVKAIQDDTVFQKWRVEKCGEISELASIPFRQIR